MSKFSDFNLDAALLRSLEEQKITETTEIQSKVIPLAMESCDLIAKAPTGTGKTLAFLLPIISKIDKNSKDVQALILCPTRELVIQICDVLKATVKYFEGIRSAGIYGGQYIQKQLAILRKKPQIVVGTPGRVLDHIIERHSLKLKNITMLVLDEGDEMFNMGFRGDIEKIMDNSNPDCQKMLFSATLPKEIKAIIEARFKSPKEVEATIDGENIPEILQYYTMIKDSQRVAALLYLKENFYYKKCIVFCNTKHRCEKLYQALLSKHVLVAMLHGDLKQSQRTAIIKEYRQGKYEMLIATDVAARGLDIDSIDAIFNFDPPTDEDFYIHRIGRTARANAKGVAYTFIDNNQLTYVQTYQKVTNNALKYMDLSNVDLGNSFTLPKDGSNRMNREKTKSLSTRYFLNVGERDLLDKDTMLKLLNKNCGLEVFDVVDIKIRDTYSFVEIVNQKAKSIYKMKGLELGKRVITIEEAKDEEKAAPKKKQNFKERDKNKKEKKLKKEKLHLKDTFKNKNKNQNKKNSFSNKAELKPKRKNKK